MDAETRANFYGLLAQAFTPPDKEWAALKTRAAHSISENIKRLYPFSTFHETLDVFRKELDNLGQVGDVDEIVLEYDRLFNSPYKIEVPPYESLYRYDEGQVMAPCAVQVEKLYKENGLEISPEFKDLPDHIMVELQFMAYLCLREAEAGKEGKEAEALQFIKKQDSFIKEHLGLWAEDFSVRLVSSSNSPFYISLGKLVSLFVKLDKDIVSLYLSM